MYKLFFLSVDEISSPDLTINIYGKSITAASNLPSGNKIVV